MAYRLAYDTSSDNWPYVIKDELHRWIKVFRTRSEAMEWLKENTCAD